VRPHIWLAQEGIFSLETLDPYVRPLVYKNFFDSSLNGLIWLHDEWKEMWRAFTKVSCMFGTGFYDSEVTEMGYPVE
jgi:hypothetical protein